ncbi:MAG: transcription termination/antitermination protein NusG [Christensenellales bacterium]|jgi:transcriptional antiterminator NusG
MSEKTPQALWYVVHTYSGYENKVKDNLEKAAENQHMQHLIQEVQVPIEEVVEIRDGKRKVKQHKTFPGYVLVKMVITSDSWYVVRNTRGVTGFVGPESKPVPLSEEEVEHMLSRRPQAEACKMVVGEEVRITEGPLVNFTGTVESIDIEHGKMQVKVKMFLGRELQVEIEISQAEKL